MLQRSLVGDPFLSFNICIKLFTILYADDTVLLAQSAQQLQNKINHFQNYCQKWNLKTNIDKSKVVIFSKGRLPENLKFTYGNRELDIVNDFNYLGVILNRTGSYQKAKQKQVSKATAALYEVLKKKGDTCITIFLFNVNWNYLIKWLHLSYCTVVKFGDSLIIQ